MKLNHYPDTDSFCGEFDTAAGVKTHEVVGGLNVDLDAHGNVVGFDLDHASRRLDLSTLETTALRAQLTHIG